MSGTSPISATTPSLDAFWHSLLGVDANDRPLTPVITWEDTRARDTVYQLCGQLDEQTIHCHTGVHFHASYWPAKLRWLSQNQPELPAQVAQWISFGEYLHRCFLGRSLCSLSMASGAGLLNISTLQWNAELVQALGIYPEQLPSLDNTCTGIRGLTSERGEVYRRAAERQQRLYQALLGV